MNEYTCRYGHTGEPYIDPQGYKNCRMCAAISRAKYNKSCRESGKMKDIKKRSNDKYLFGGNREAEIQRDGEKCVRCGTTRQEHFNKFNRDLNVDHIDGKGCPVPKAEKNNDLDNLQTLCHDCHRHKDSDKSPHKLTDMQVINIFHIGRA